MNYSRISESIININSYPGYYKYVEITDSVNRCVLTEKYVEKYFREIENFEVFNDDVWVITFPKCGTTWTQEIIWLLNNNLNYEIEKSSTLDERFPFIELGALVNEPIESIKNCENLSRPRHIKTHLPKFLLPKQLWTVRPKIIYVTRNPKDAAVSYYHHYRHIFGYTGTKDEFFQNFLNGNLLHSPMNEHVLEYWNLRHEPNILFLHYEDMKKNIKKEILKMARFLDKNYSDEAINYLCQHVSFESMKTNDSCNKSNRVKMVKEKNNYASKSEEFSFIREGKIGSSDKEMTSDQLKKFDEYMKFEKFQRVEFSYKTSFD